MAGWGAGSRLPPYLGFLVAVGLAEQGGLEVHVEARLARRRLQRLRHLAAPALDADGDALVAAVRGALAAHPDQDLDQGQRENDLAENPDGDERAFAEERQHVEPLRPLEQGVLPHQAAHADHALVSAAYTMHRASDWPQGKHCEQLIGRKVNTMTPTHDTGG